MAPLALSFGLASGAEAQPYSDQPGDLDTERPEVLIYKNEVRSRLERTLAPFGLRYGGVRGKHFRSYHIGYPLGESGVSVGVSYFRQKGNLTPLERTGSEVQFGVNFVLSLK